MSKKQLSSRLNSLFAHLEESEPVASPATRSGVLPSWSWEVDNAGLYLTISADVQDALGLSPQKFIGQSIFSYKISPQSASELRNLLQSNQFPLEFDVYYLNAENQLVTTRMMVFSNISESGQPEGWRGFTQVVLPAGQIESSASVGTIFPPTSSPGTPPAFPAPVSRATSIREFKSARPAAGTFWTKTARHSSQSLKTSAIKGSEDEPAVLAVPVKLSDEEHAVIEILDDRGQRAWTENDQLLVEEVSRQLSLALENARLYQTVQQELSERVKAEQEIIRRSQDLAALNQAGQQLSKLASREEILNLVKDSIGRLVDNRNLCIALFDEPNQRVSFPIHQVNGQPSTLESRPLQAGVVDHVLMSKTPMLITTSTGQVLTEKGITLPNPVPASLVAIPLLAGERVVGAFILQDFDTENAFTPLHVELLSTLASQVTTALENTNLFQEIRNALQSLETRERYQANVARAVALLTESGTSALPDVLSAIGQASMASRVYYAEAQQEGSDLNWRMTSAWVDSSYTYVFDSSRMQRVLVSDFPHWTSTLKEKGWFSGTLTQFESPEKEFLHHQGIFSTLLLSVPGKNATPGFIAIDQLYEEREWLKEEVNVLRVAADALSNTFIREDLLGKLQVSLDETETLYNASHSLALASTLDEMVQAVALSLNTPTINRAVLALFENNAKNELFSLKVESTWHSGQGTPPPSVGTQLPLNVYGKAFSSANPIFYSDIFESRVPGAFRDLLAHENIRSLAILPLWIGKRQLGVLLLQAEDRHVFTERETRSYPPLIDQMATAVENLRLFQQTQDALAETGLLYEISSGISQAATPGDLITLVGSRMMPQQAYKAGIWQITQTSPSGEPLEFEIVGCYQVGEGCRAVGINFSAQKFPYWTKLASETTIINSIETPEIDTVTRHTLQNIGIQSGVFVPLSSGSHLIGFLVAASDHPATFADDEVRLLKVAGSGISVALEKQRLLTEAQQRARELQTAAEIARDTTSTLSTDILLSRMVNLIRDRFDFYHVSIFLLDETRNFAIVRESTGDAGKALKQRNHRLAVGSRSVIGSATSTGQTICLNDVSLSPLYYPNPLLPETRSETGIPLKLGDQVIGALDLQSTQPNAFSQDDLTVLQILGDQIAVAIENARAYELTQKAFEDMKEVDRLKSQFLANMSHELRTPLNSIIGFSRVILKGIDGPINDTQKQDLSAIYNSGQHLLTLINNILDLSKIEAGKMELQYADINLSDLINSVMSTAVGLVKDRPVRLNQIIPDYIPTVQADPTRIRQVLLNFVSNAAKFTEQGIITVEASLSTDPTGKPEVMVTITDTGAGIAPQDQYKLFQPFSQVDDSPTRKTGGTGLGLSICRSFIEMHNGRIGLLRSEIGVGSTFFFTLPLPQPEQTEEETNGTNVILSIDDDPQVISLYQRYLRPQGYQVIPVTNPREAVARAIELKPYAITLDIMMPDIDGWSVMQALKTDPQTRNIPILVCSILEEEEKGFSLGASDYLVKPFLQEDLSNAINRLNNDGKIHKILVIDDDPEDLRLVQKMLDQNTGFEVQLAEGGTAGWEAITTNPPDAIILDLFMPGMNGFAILENLRSSTSLQNIPVIVLTGADLTADHLAQMNAFGQSMLNKGILREKELLNTLEQALRKIRF